MDARIFRPRLTRPAEGTSIHDINEMLIFIIPPPPSACLVWMICRASFSPNRFEVIYAYIYGTDRPRKASAGKKERERMCSILLKTWNCTVWPTLWQQYVIPSKNLVSLIHSYVKEKTASVRNKHEFSWQIIEITYIIWLQPRPDKVSISFHLCIFDTIQLLGGMNGLIHCVGSRIPIHHRPFIK